MFENKEYSHCNCARSQESGIVLENSKLSFSGSRSLETYSTPLPVLVVNSSYFTCHTQLAHFKGLASLTASIGYVTTDQITELFALFNNLGRATGDQTQTSGQREQVLY